MRPLSGLAAIPSSRVLLPMCLLLVGCKTVHVKESQFFDPRPATLPDSVRTGYWPDGYRVKEGRIPLSDSVSLYRLLLEAPGAEQVVLYLGGSNFQIGQDFSRLRPLTRLGVHVFAVDYPGYGESGGTSSIESFHAAALAAYDEALRVTGVSPDRLIVHGHSLGTMLAMYVAEQRQVGAVVLEGPATNAREWARSFVPWAFRPFVRLDIPPSLTQDDNLQRVARFHSPLLLLVGADDRDTNPAMARRLYKAAGTPADQKRLHVFARTQHMVLRSNPAAVDAYRAFLGDVVRR